jgi:archaemetzincin
MGVEGDRIAPATGRRRSRPAPSIVDLVPIYLAGERRLLAGLAAALARSFAAEVRLRPPWFDPEASFDLSRGQYSSNRLLAQLLTGPPDGASRVLGVTGVDLFIPVLTWVYGEAQLDGRAAVVSTHRLRAERYGLPADPALLAARAEKEAVHELGHTFGLVHCADPRCVMRASTYVEEIDLKTADFCASCRRVVAGGRNGDRP